MNINSKTIRRQRKSRNSWMKPNGILVISYVTTKSYEVHMRVTTKAQREGGGRGGGGALLTFCFYFSVEISVFIFYFSVFVFNISSFTSLFCLSVFFFYFSLFIFKFLIFTDLFSLRASSHIWASEAFSRDSFHSPRLESLLAGYDLFISFYFSVLLWLLYFRFSIFSFCFCFCRGDEWSIKIFNC